MRFQGNFKIAAIVALGVMLIASIAGAAVFALTTLRDTTEDTPVAAVGETAAAAAGPVVAVGQAAPGSPIEPADASADASAAGTLNAPSSVSATLSSCSTSNSTLSCGVSVTWAAPRSSLGGAVENYEAEIKLSDGTGSALESGSLSSSTYSYSFTLGAYGKYTAGVRATNADEASVWATNSVLVAEVPDAIASISASRGTGTLELSWTVPDENGSDIKNYEVECKVITSTQKNWATCGGSPFTASGAAGSTFSATVTGVNDADGYSVRARAVNEIGGAAWKISPIIPAN